MRHSRLIARTERTFAFTRRVLLRHGYPSEAIEDHDLMVRTWVRMNPAPWWHWLTWVRVMRARNGTGQVG